MKNLTKLVLLLVLIVSPFSTSAQVANFSIPLSYGSSAKAEVLKLQRFLVSTGFLSIAPTGNFLSLTQEAVKAFQRSQGIDPIGVFGPLTRAAANKYLAQDNTPKASVVSQDVSSNTSGAAVFLANSQKIQWKTVDYPANVGVNVNLLRKKSDSPLVYELVRKIATNTPNDGEEVWTPLATEKGSDMYIEVTCSTTYTFKGGCSLSQTPTKVQ